MLINNRDELRKNLIELKCYYHRVAKELIDKYLPDEEGEEPDIPEEEYWRFAKAVGGEEACDTIFLAAFGGQELSVIMEMIWEGQSLADELNGKGEVE